MWHRTLRRQVCTVNLSSEQSQIPPSFVCLWKEKRFLRSLPGTGIVSIAVGGCKKFWTLSPDFPGRQDKQATQHLCTLQSKWRTLRHCSNFLNQKILTPGNVYHDIIGQSLGKASPNLLFLSKRFPRTPRGWIPVGKRVRKGFA